MPNHIQYSHGGKEFAFAKRREKEAQDAQEPHYEHSSVSSSESEEDTDAEGSKSFLPTGRSSSRERSGSSHRSSKSDRKRKKKKSSRHPHFDNQGSDQEAPRPLSSSFHHNRQEQRLYNHPTIMAGGKSARGKGPSKPSSTRGAASKRSAESAADQEPDDTTQKENEALKLELARIRKKIKLEQSGKSAQKSSSQTAMEREVRKCAKTKLWKVCKFIKNSSKLDKAVKFVMEALDLQELEGLKGTALVDAQETWMATYKVEVRTALNKQRNYVQQELREVMQQVFKENKEAEFPNEKQILHLILREKLDADTPEKEREAYQKMFDNYWNVLIPKVAGHSSWGPSKRHHELLSTGKEDEESDDCLPYVTPSDEAFLAIIWLNCYKRWWFREQHRRANLGTDLDEEAAEMQTPYTDAKSGQMKFGGWNAAGIKKYGDLEKKIVKNRETEETYIKAVEEAALERIRKDAKVEEMEANRKTKKRTGKNQQELFADEDDDENDYSKW